MTGVQTCALPISDEILIGFFAAIAVEFILSYYRAYKSAKRHVHTGIETEPRAVFRAIFRNPVISAGLHGETFIVKADGPMTTFNRRFIPPCPQGAREVILDVSNPGVTYVDHTIHDLFLQLRMSCCGKSNFKLYGFVPLDSKGHASGWVRFERRNGESRDDVAFERRQGDRVA